MLLVWRNGRAEDPVDRPYSFELHLSSQHNLYYRAFIHDLDSIKAAQGTSYLMDPCGVYW